VLLDMSISTTGLGIGNYLHDITRIDVPFMTD